MEPKEFQEHWAVTYDELAELCGRLKAQSPIGSLRESIAASPPKQISVGWRKFMHSGANLKTGPPTSEKSESENGIRCCQECMNLLPSRQP